MKLGYLQEEIRQLEKRVSDTPDMPLPELQEQVVKLERFLREMEDECGVRRFQREQEAGVGRLISSLETRARSIKEEASEYEASDFAHEAHAISVEAANLERRLVDLRQKMFERRVESLPRLKEEAQALEPTVKDLEVRFNEFVTKTVDKKEQEAAEEDKLSEPEKRKLLLHRVARFYVGEAIDEYDYLSVRARHFARAQAVMRSEADVCLENYAIAIRGAIQDIENMVSEGLKDKDIEGAELAISYAMRKHWKEGDRDGFYARLWTLNLLLLTFIGMNADQRLLQKVRSLLNYLNQDGLPEDSEMQGDAKEARRFLLMAGNGVIRRFLEEQYNGLKTVEDFSSLGRDLDGNRWRLLQMAVMMPRLFDLSLSNRLEKIFRKRLDRRPSHAVTPFPEMRQTDSPEDLPDVSPDEFIPGWEARLAAGELAVTRYEDQKVEQSEVGTEKHMEVQVYLLDVSPSMYEGYGSGQRFLARDAIFIAALNSYSVDAALKGVNKFPNRLIMRVFSGTVEDPEEIFTVDEALRKLKNILCHHISGKGAGTDIQSALEAAYTDIRSAKGASRFLKDAKVVLVSDGESALDVDRLREMQRSIELVPQDLRRLQVVEKRVKDTKARLKTARRELRGLQAGGDTGAIRRRQAEIQRLQEEMDGAAIELESVKRQIDTKIVTHIFAIELEEQYEAGLRVLEEPGRSFFVKIPDASSRSLAKVPPYGTKFEFSPVMQEVSFDSDGEREQFNGRVSKMCDEIVGIAQDRRKQREAGDLRRAETLQKVISSPRAMREEPYESDRVPAKADLKERRSARMVDILRVMEDVVDEHTTLAEAMEMLEFLTRERCLRQNDIAQMVKRTSSPKLIEALKGYRSRVLSRLK